MVVGENGRPRRAVQPAEGPQLGNAVLGPDLALGQVGQALAENIGERGEQVVESEETVAGDPAGSRAPIPDASGGPGGEKGNSMAALIGRSLVAAEWASCGLGPVFRPVVAGKDEEGVVEKPSD